MFRAKSFSTFLDIPKSWLSPESGLITMIYRIEAQMASLLIRLVVCLLARYSKMDKFFSQIIYVWKQLKIYQIISYVHLKKKQELRSFTFRTFENKWFDCFSLKKWTILTGITQEWIQLKVVGTFEPFQEIFNKRAAKCTRKYW